jgi:hypothetical protein
MPDLHISNGRGQMLPWAFVDVLATMYFPTDPDKQESFISANFGSELVDVMEGKSPGPREEILAALSKPGGGLFNILGSAGALPAIMEETRRARPRGMIAASVLATVIRSSPFATLSSVTRAKRLVEAVTGRPLTYVSQDWTDFKTVAHLYLAMDLFHREARQERRKFVDELVEEVKVDQPETQLRAIAEGEIDKAEPDIFEVFHEGNFPYFLALSEKIRRTAEDQSRQSLKPWMASGEAYSVPADLEIGDARLFMPALDQRETEILSARGTPSGKRNRDQSK